MDPISAVIASGLRSRMESLDMLANNISNSGTTGYKVDREVFSLFLSEDGLENTSPSRMPLVEDTWIDFSQGTLQNTGNPTDMALSGEGLFTVQGKDGPLYTRNGSFQMAQNGNLITQEGYALVGQGGKPVQLDPTRDFTVDSQGILRQQGAEVGRLEIVTAPDKKALGKFGANYYKVAPGSAGLTPAVTTTVHQGKTESSNVGPAEAAVRLVSILRQFESLQKALQLTSDMGKKAIEDVARPNA